MKVDPNRRDEMILREGDAVELALMVLERFASTGGALTGGDALLIASTIRLLADHDPPRTLKLAEVRLVRTMHYGPPAYKSRIQGRGD